MSTYAISLFLRMAKPALLFLPLTTLIFLALAWSLNGDIWRLGLVDPPPGESGVAPFAIRMWLAIALGVVLAGWLVMGCSRCWTGRDGERNGSVMEREKNVDPWEAEWGLEAARKARRERVKAVERFLVRREVFEHAERRETVNGNGDALSSESQPLLSPHPATPSAVSSPRSIFRSFIPLPSPLNLPTFLLATVPRVVLSFAPSADSNANARGLRLTARVEVWIWRAVALFTGLGVWESWRKGLERVRRSRADR